MKVILLPMQFRENKNQAMTVPAEVLGVDLVSRAIPVHDEQGSVIGGVGVGFKPR